MRLRVLSENDIFVLKRLTETIEHLYGQIFQLEDRIEIIANQRDLEIVSSVPGVGKRSAAAILAEIGMLNGLEMVSRLRLELVWLLHFIRFCLRLRLGSITKQGFKWLRWNMVDVAHATVRVRDSRF